MIPVLETKRLILREWRESDVDSMAEIYANEDNCRFVGGTISRNAVWAKICMRLGAWHLQGFGIWCVEHKDSGETIGGCGLLYPSGWPEAEMGYTFHAAHHGQGFATEAATAALIYAYKTLGWKTAISVINAGNFPSQKLAKRLGAHKEQDCVHITSFFADIWRHLPAEEFLERFA